MYAKPKNVIVRFMEIYGLILFITMTQSAYGADTVRDLKNFSGPGITFTISISIQPPEGTVVVALEEIPPVDWTVSNISDSGIWDLQSEKIKWGLFFNPSIPSIVSYDIAPPTEFISEQCFIGIVSFDGTNQDIGGDRCIAAAIPTLSGWGLIILTLLVLVCGIVFIERRPGRIKSARNSFFDPDRLLKGTRVR